MVLQDLTKEQQEAIKKAIGVSSVNTPVKVIKEMLEAEIVNARLEAANSDGDGDAGWWASQNEAFAQAALDLLEQ